MFRNAQGISPFMFNANFPSRTAWRSWQIAELIGRLSSILKLPWFIKYFDLEGSVFRDITPRSPVKSEEHVASIVKQSSPYCLQCACFLLGLKIEAICFSEISVDFQPAICFIEEEIIKTVNLKSYTFKYIVFVSYDANKTRNRMESICYAFVENSALHLTERSYLSVHMFLLQKYLTDFS